MVEKPNVEEFWNDTVDESQFCGWFKFQNDIAFVFILEQPLKKYELKPKESSFGGIDTYIRILQELDTPDEGLISDYVMLKVSGNRMKILMKAIDKEAKGKYPFKFGIERYGTGFATNYKYIPIKPSTQTSLPDTVTKKSDKKSKEVTKTD